MFHCVYFYMRIIIVFISDNLLIFVYFINYKIKINIYKIIFYLCSLSGPSLPKSSTLCCPCILLSNSS